MKKKHTKKGLIISNFLIGIIILVVSFIIILFLLRLFPFGSSIAKETCHQSVVLRSTAKIGPIDANEVIPLKCQTSKICLTMSGEDCNELINTRKNPVQKIRLNKDVQKAREEIMKVFAESMITCHSMLGEGQLNFMPKQLTTKNYGLICSRIVFDQEVKNKIEDIGAGEFFAYLESQVTNDQSYLEYLYPGWKNSQNSIKLFEAFKQENKQFENVNFVDWKIINLNEENGHAIIAQIAPTGNWASWAAGITTAIAVPAGVALIATGIGAPVGAVLIGGAGTIGAISLVSGGAVLWYTSNDKFDYSPPTIYPYNIKILQDLGIYSFEIAP